MKLHLSRFKIYKNPFRVKYEFVFYLLKYLVYFYIHYSIKFRNAIYTEERSDLEPNCNIVQ